MKYLVKLKSLDKFFFGKNHTFGDDNYFAKSSYLPQQTQILGMLRKELLIQNGFLTQKRRGEWVDKPKSEVAKKYLGGESFKIDLDTKQDLGVINEISPIFLLDKDDSLCYFMAKDYGIYLDAIEDGIPDLKLKSDDKPYKEKKAKKLCSQLISAKEEYSLDKVFIEDTQVGITKGRIGATDDNAFFKKTSYKLNKEFCFAFVLDLSDELCAKFDSTIVTLGGERSMFKMEVLKEHHLSHTYDQELEKLYEKEKHDKLILLSDTYIKSDNQTIFDATGFAITDSVAVRTIDSKVTKWKKKEKDIEKYYFQKSITYNLFKQGSVFYKPTKDLEKMIENKNLQNIGYNKYKIIKGEQNG